MKFIFRKTGKYDRSYDISDRNIYSLELVIDPKELTRLFCKLTSRVSMFDQSARFRQFRMNDDFVEKRQVGYNLSSFYFNSSFC